MGMNIQSKADLAAAKGTKLNFDAEESKQISPVAPGPSDGTQNEAKDLIPKKSPSQTTNAKKALRYTKDQILQIYKGLGNFKSPLANPEQFDIKEENKQYL